MLLPCFECCPLPHLVIVTQTVPESNQIIGVLVEELSEII